MNYFAQQIGQSYDEQGQLARQGQPQQYLIETLNALPYYSQPFPKSLGYEWVYREVIQRIEEESLEVADAIATGLHQAACQIAQDLQFFAEEQLTNRPFQVLVTGGGAFNSYLLECIREYGSEQIALVIPDEKLVSFKEALIFALLGVLRVRNEVNCLSSVTGAQYDHSAGVIYGKLD